jgi:hypothetical protein
MKELNDFVFAVYDIEENSLEKFVPDSQEKIIFRLGDFGEPERAVETLYKKSLDYQVANLYHKYEAPLKRAMGLCGFYENRSSTPALPVEVAEYIQTDILKNLEVSESEDLLGVIEIDVLPDLLAYNQDTEDYVFTEVKQPNERLRSSQIEWIKNFHFLPVNIVYVFNNKENFNKYSHRLKNRLQGIFIEKQGEQD